MKQKNFFDHFCNQINTKAKDIDFNKLVEMANLIRSTERQSGKIILVFSYHRFKSQCMSA